jgi:hypothetical protein
LRNSDVVVEVLFRAKGVCEHCNKPAPFTRAKDMCKRDLEKFINQGDTDWRNKGCDMKKG